MSDEKDYDGMPAITDKLTAEEVGKIFLAVENTVTDHRSAQGQKRLLKMGGLVTAATAIATAVSVAAASFGFKVIGPPAEVAEVKRSVSAVDTKVEDLKLVVDSIVVDRQRYRYYMESKLTELSVKQDQTQYLVCVLIRRQDPTLVPKECNK